ncbi:MAG: VWA domain-containing protein [Bacteroidales bacterium]
MIQFAQAEYFILVLFIPILFLFHGINRRIRRRRVEKLGDRAILEQLMPRASAARGWIKLSILSIALFFFAVGLARPQLGARIKEIEGTGIEIMIALDVSNSMLAQDFSPNRLERAKLAISRLTDKLGQDRVGLIVFAGQAFVQLPITTDYVSAKMFLNSINTNSVPIQGTSLADAINLSVKSFSAESVNSSKAIILITDGEDHEDDPVSAAKTAAELGAVIYTIGIGSLEGKPIPMPNGELLKDREGNIVVTRLDEETLVKVAQAGGGKYIRAGISDFGLETIVNQIRSMDKQSFSSVVFEDFNEQYMYFFAIALIFFILEFIITERKGRIFFR